MTHKQWIKLTPQEKQMKVAELCGWSFFEFQDNKLAGFFQTVYQTRPQKFGYHIVPDFCNDLNAMHEVEKIILEKELWYEWLGRLRNVTNDRTPYMATAEERAEAFVLTMTSINRFYEMYYSEHFNTTLKDFI